MTNWQKRALRTFFQTFFGTISTQILMCQYDKLNGTIWVSIISSAIAGGISAIMNLEDKGNGF